MAIGGSQNGRLDVSNNGFALQSLVSSPYTTRPIVAIDMLCYNGSAAGYWLSSVLIVMCMASLSPHSHARSIESLEEWIMIVRPILRIET